jgi:Fe-S-cluster containining protein
MTYTIEEIRQYLEQGKSPDCWDCHECCWKMILKTKAEKDRLAFFDKPNAKEWYCEYLDKDGKCSCYEERPIVCRAFGKVKHPCTTCPKFKELAVLDETDEIKEYKKQAIEDSFSF